jgi:hypothetical protein
LVPVGQEQQDKVPLVGHLMEHLTTRAGEAGEQVAPAEQQQLQLVAQVAPGPFHLLPGHLQLMPAGVVVEIITGELVAVVEQVGAVEVPLVLSALLEHQTLVAGAVQEAKYHQVLTIMAALVARGLSSYVYPAFIQQLSQVD